MRSSQRIRQTLRKYQRKPITQQGILGNEVGEISVPNRVDYVYVRIAGLGTISIYNKRVPLILDLPVDVGYDPLEPKNFQVLNIHRYPQGGGRGLVDVATILHGKTHNWAGIDPVFIEKRQIMPLRPTPLGGMQVYVTREVTYYDDKAVSVTGQQLNLAPYVPATGSWMVLLYKDTDEIIKVSTGGALKDLFTLSLADAPQVYPGTVPIALIRLYGGQSGIAEGYQDTDLIDVRQLFSPIDTTGTSSGGGHIIQDEGVSRPARTNLNFKGASIWAVDNAGADSTDVIISGTSSGGIVTGAHDIQDEGVGLPYRPAINFKGSLITAADNPGQNRIDVTVSEPMIVTGTVDRYIGAYNYQFTNSSVDNYVIGLTKGPDERHLRRVTEPIVGRGAGGSWDDWSVKDPCLIDVNGVLWLFYSGNADATYAYKIGLSRSWDGGATWTKYASNPVLSETEAWELIGIRFPAVLYDRAETDSSKRWKMWYCNSSNVGTGGIGYAYSADGLTWTKYAGNPVLSPGAGGSWDEGITSKFVIRLGDTYYLFYGGTGSFGLATFTDPEGTYTKSASNPLLSGDGINSAITSNVGIGDVSIAVADATVFPIGAPVWVFDNSHHYLSHVSSRPDSTHIVVTDAAPVAIASATGNVRSILYGNAGLGSVIYDGGWKFAIVPWSPGIDAGLKEMSMWAFSQDLTDVIVDYGAGCIIKPTLAESQMLEVSAENLSLIPLWRSDDRYTLPDIPAEHDPVTVVDSATIDLSLTGQQLTADLKNTTVVPASYTHTSITVDQQGRITAASNGSPASGRYRQFLYYVNTGSFYFLTDVDGNPLMGLLDLEA